MTPYKSTGYRYFRDCLKILATSAQEFITTGLIIKSYYQIMVNELVALNINRYDTAFLQVYL